MPVMDGYVATSIIREYQKFDHIPIVALTANMTQTQIEKAKSYGMQHYLSKPIDNELFYKALLQYMQPKQNLKIVPNAYKEQRRSHAISNELPGVNIQEGLARLNGNQQIYNEILLKFYDIFENAIPSLNSMIAAKSYRAASDYAHDMKGLAGNIGAAEIYEIAKDLDIACKEHAERAGVIIQELDKHLTPLLQAIKSVVVVSQDDQESKQILPKAILNQYLDQLNKAASGQKGRDAKKICDILEQYQWPSEHTGMLSEIVKASKGYDFKKVQKLIAYITK